MSTITARQIEELISLHSGVVYFDSELDSTSHCRDSKRVWQMAEIADFLAARVRCILINEWDPIGIKEIPEAQDEYDSYVLQICGMLLARCSSNDLYKHLRWIESEHMGFDGDTCHTHDIAKKLANLSI